MTGGFFLGLWRWVFGIGLGRYTAGGGYATLVLLAFGGESVEFGWRPGLLRFARNDMVGGFFGSATLGC